MSTTNKGGGQVDQLKIDPVTGTPYTAAGKVSGTDINGVTAAKNGTADTDSVEKPEVTTIVVQGTPGRGIQSAEVVNDHLILTFTDGATYDVGPVGGTDGTNGTNGTNGVGVASATVNNLGHLVLTLTNNALVDAGVVAGPGFVGANVDNDGHLILTDTADEQIDLGVVRGVAGTNGKTILSGAADPAAGVGTNGDFYLNTTSLLLFGPKASGAWPAGVLLKGTDGLNGKTVLSGAGAPTGGLGVNGDFYIDTTALNLYGPKGTPSAGWNTPVSLKGSDGIGFVGAVVDGAGHLILTKSDTNTVDAGLVKGQNGLMPTLPGFEELVSLDEGDLSEGETYLVLGRDAPYDGLGGIFAWDATSTETDDGENIVALDPAVATGRFKVVQKLFKPVVASSIPADATDEATAVTLVNALKQLLIDNGFID